MLGSPSPIAPAEPRAAVLVKPVDYQHEASAVLSGAPCCLAQQLTPGSDPARSVQAKRATAGRSGTPVALAAPR